MNKLIRIPAIKLARLSITVCMLLATLLVPSIGHALGCKEESTNAVVLTDNLPGNLSAPANAADGTVLWRSPERTIRVLCWSDWDPSVRGAIFFVVNPEHVALGQGIEVGIVYKGTTDTKTSGLIYTGHDINGAQTTFNLTYSTVILKKGAIPGNGVATLNNYRVFQLDGGPLNAAPGRNLNQVINGTIRFTKATCSLNTPSVAVPLGTIKASSFTGVGTSSPSQSFKIGLSCEGGDPDATTTVFATLTDQTAPGNRSDQLTLTPASTATGIAIQVLHDSTVLKYGPDSNASDNVNQWQAGTTGNGTFDIPLAARYVQTASKVTAGSANAKATVTMSYR